MIVSEIGRARLEQNNSWMTILIKDKLEDSFDVQKDNDGKTIKGRPVKHVGSKEYIMRIWNKMMKNQDKYLKNPQTIFDFCLSDRKIRFNSND